MDSGERVTIRVRKCDPGSSITVGLGQSPSSGPQATYPYFEFMTESNKPTNGYWATTATVPAIIIGPAMLGARCNGPLRQINTPSVSVDVKTPYRVQVTPTTVRRGQWLAIAAFGPGCGDIDLPTAFLWSPASASTWGVAEVNGQTGAQSPWTLNLAVPATAAPGRYYVVARCEYSRSFTRTYQPVAVSVGM